MFSRSAFLCLIVVVSTCMSTVAQETPGPLEPGSWTILSHGAVEGGDTYADVVNLWMAEAALHLASFDRENTVIHTFDRETFEPIVLGGLDHVLNPPGLDPTAIGDVTLHHILLFEWTETAELDWFDGKNRHDGDQRDIRASDGYAYAAGDALYALIRYWGIESRIATMLGHSRGSIVVSEATRRLILNGTPPTQVIYLDGEGGDFVGLGYADNLFTAWDNPMPGGNPVRYDNIYSTVDEGAALFPWNRCYQGLDFGGNPVENCYNYNLGIRYRHGACDSFDWDDDDGPFPAPIWEYIAEFTVGDTRLRFAADDEEVVVPPSSGSEPLDPDEHWGGSSDFEHVDDRIIYNGRLDWKTNAGWRNHGGGGTGGVFGWPWTNFYISLTPQLPGQPDEIAELSHSWFWLGDYEYCTFSYRVASPSEDGGHLYLRLEHKDNGITTTEEFEVASILAYTDWRTETFPVPAAFRDGLCRLTFVVADNGLPHEDGVVRVDDVSFVVEPPEVEGQPNVVLSLDRSGSMDYGFWEPGVSYLENAQNAAATFAQNMQPGDRIGVVSFASGATTEFPLTEITGQATIGAAQDAIMSITAGGGTSIGGGLQRSQELLTGSGDDSAPWSVILLSDGDENQPPYVADVLPTIPDQTRVYSIGLGAYTNEPLMNNIAAVTDGAYFISPTTGDLLGIYTSIQGLIGGLQNAVTISGEIQQGEVIELDGVPVEVGADLAQFQINWPGSDLDLALESPSGVLIDESFAGGNPGVEYFEGETSEYFRVYVPESGSWTMKVSGIDVPDEGEPYTATLLLESPLQLDLAFSEEEYVNCESIHLQATLREGDLGIAGATVVAEVNVPQDLVLDRDLFAIGIAERGRTDARPDLPERGGPTRSITTILLHDDGGHGDGEAGDGVYGAHFNETAIPGSYSFEVTATGTSSNSGDFSRTAIRAVVVVEGEAPAPVAAADAVPRSGQAPLEVSFSDLSNGCISSYSWNFGDGATSEVSDPVHTYLEPGDYLVTLQVTGPGGADQDSLYIEVSPAGCVWDVGQDAFATLATGARGLAWADYDGDGDQDLFICRHHENVLYDNDNGELVVATGWTDVDRPSRAATWVDYDNDGDLDLYVVDHGHPNRLYENEAGILAEVPAGAAGDAGDGYNAAWADIDLDGDLDLFIANESDEDVLLMNESGSFVAVESVVATNGATRGCAFGDYDNDGDPDLYVSRVGQNFLFRNEGGTFVDATDAVLGDESHGKGVAWGDYDNDGDLDLYLVNSNASNRLYRNDLEEGFVDVSSDITGDGGSGRAGTWGDYDNDGWLDLYIANAYGPDRLFQNLAGVFADSTCGRLAEDGGLTAWACSFADVDGDGDLDLATAVDEGNERSRVFYNGYSRSVANWLQVDLAGVNSNRFGVGARIVVNHGTNQQIREVSASSGYLSQGPLTVSFGLGEATIVDVAIRWPSGIVQTLPSVAANQRILVEEQSGVTFVGGIPVPREFSVENYPNPFNPSTTIVFGLPRAAEISIDIFDVLGRRIRTLTKCERYPAGEHEVQWHGRDDRGRAVNSGVYLYRVTGGDKKAIGRMTLLK